MNDYMVFRVTKETRQHGAGVAEVDKFYGTTDNPLSDPEKSEWRTSRIKLPESMLFGLEHDNAPVVVNKSTGHILFVVLPTHNRDGFYRPLKSERGKSNE